LRNISVRTAPTELPTHEPEVLGLAASETSEMTPLVNSAPAIVALVALAPDLRRRRNAGKDTPLSDRRAKRQRQGRTSRRAERVPC
jgi:hypothetical protein